MRFKVDENFPRAVKDLLVEKGHDVQTDVDEELVGEADLRWREQRHARAG